MRVSTILRFSGALILTAVIIAYIVGYAQEQGSSNAKLIMIQPKKITSSPVSSPDSVIVISLKPGSLLFVPSASKGKNIQVTVEADKTYYLLAAKDAQSQKILGSMLYADDDKSGALTAYRTALALDPSITGIYNNYADLITETGKPDEVIAILSKVIASGKADSTIYYAIAKAYLKKNDLVKADNIYNQLLQQNPQSLSALSGMASVKQKQGNFAEAATTLEQIVKANPAAKSDYKLLGDCYTGLKQTQQAMDEYSTFLDREGKDQSLANRVGTYYYTQKQYARAIKYLLLVKEPLTNAVTYQFMLGDCYFRTQESHKAILLLEAALKKNPAKAVKDEIFKKLAESYLDLEENEKALKWFNLFLKGKKSVDAQTAYLRAFLTEKQNAQKAQKLFEENIKSYPDDYRNFMRLGVLYAKSTATRSRSIDMFQKASDLADTVPSIWLEMAKAYKKLGNTEEELKAYQKYVKSDPDNAEANLRIGTLLMDKNNNDGIQFLAKAYKKEPNNIAILLALAKGLMQISRFNDALPVLQKAQSMDAGNATVRENLITVYRSLNMEAQALDETKKSLADKRNPATLLLYAQLLFKTGKLADAANAVEDLLATNPENIQALMLKITLLMAQKKYEEALSVCKEISILDPKYAPALYEQAEIYRLQNKPMWAEKYYNNTLNADPKYAPAEIGLADIAALRNNNAEYRKRVQRAYELTPRDSAVLDRYKKLK